MKTYQDLQQNTDRPAFIMQAINEHKASEMYRIAYDAELYDRQLNTAIMAYQKILYTMSGRAVPDNYSANYKIASNFFNRFVTQENQYLLGNGVTLERKENKKKLGGGFDAGLQQAGRDALVGGVSFVFWNFDHIEVFKLTEFVPIYDEENGALMAGIRFWQVDSDKPLRATLYELDGYTDYIKQKDKPLEVKTEKRTYQQIVRQSEADGVQIEPGDNYPGFPVIPLWGNAHHQSEFVGMRENIDAYDLIKSGFANDLDDCTQIYWLLQNAGGMDDVDIAKFLDRVRATGAAALPDGDEGAAAEPHTIEIPYQSRMAYLDRLEQDMYNDFQALNVTSLSAAAKTATEINAAYQPFDNKVDQYEYCVLEMLEKLFALIGIDDTPTFTRNRISNRTEEMQMLMLAAPYLDDEYITHKACAILGDPDAADDILKRKDAENLDRFDRDTLLQKDTSNSVDEVAPVEDVIESAEDAAGKTLNGAQTQSLIQVIGQLSAGVLTEGQAINIISTAIGVSKQEAATIIRGE